MKNQRRLFFKLGLPRPFLRSENEKVPLRKLRENPPPAETKLGDDELRLDLAGDVHHYARYWGPTSKNTSTDAKAFPSKGTLKERELCLGNVRTRRGVSSSLYYVRRRNQGASALS